MYVCIFKRDLFVERNCMNQNLVCKKDIKLNFNNLTLTSLGVIFFLLVI